MQAAFAPLLSDGPIIVLMVPILTRLPPTALGWMHLASELFILYMARGIPQAWGKFDAAVPQTTRASQRNLLKAAEMNMLSPGPYIFWGLVAGPTAGTRGSRPPVRLGLPGSVLRRDHHHPERNHRAIWRRRATRPVHQPRSPGLSAIALAAFGLYPLWRSVSALLD